LPSKVLLGLILPLQPFEPHSVTPRQLQARSATAGDWRYCAFLTIQDEPFIASCCLLAPSYTIDEQSPSGIRFQPYKLGTVAVAQGAAYRGNGLCSQWIESDFLSQLGSVPWQLFDKPSRA
jgi:hypothetical protein